jgi:hypothetical protein
MARYKCIGHHTRTTEEITMTEYDWALRGFALFGAVVFTYYVARHGLGWVWTKLKTWWTAAETDIQALDARVSTLEVAVGLKSVVSATAATGPTGPK